MVVNEFKPANSEFPLDIDGLLMELEEAVEVGPAPEGSIKKYRAILENCSFDAVDVFSDYGKDETPIPVMDEYYVGFEDTEEKAKLRCLKAYMTDFVEAFSNGVSKVYDRYQALEKAEHKAVTFYMDLEDALKSNI